VTASEYADFVLLDANPLEKIANTRRIRAVVANGRLYRREQLDDIMAEVEAKDRPHRAIPARRTSPRQRS
jgi:hypothetical protein